MFRIQVQVKNALDGAGSRAQLHRNIAQVSAA